jgi:hypothetical protein
MNPNEQKPGQQHQGGQQGGQGGQQGGGGQPKPGQQGQEPGQGGQHGGRQSRGKADRVASAKASAGSYDQFSPALAGDFFSGNLFGPEFFRPREIFRPGALRRRATLTLVATGDLEDAATNRRREVQRLYSTGAAAAVELGVELGPLDLGASAQNGPCQRVGILAEGPNRRKFMAARAGQYQRRLPVLSAFICKFDGAVNGFAPIAEGALQLAGLHDPLFAPLQHDELDELGHLVKSAKQPNQKDDRNRDSAPCSARRFDHHVHEFISGPSG